MAQPVTTPPEWRRRAEQARSWVPAAAPADQPAADDTELGRLAAEGLAALDVDDAAVAADRAARCRAMVWDQPGDVAGVRIGPDQFVFAHAGRQPFNVLGTAALFLVRSFEAAGDDDDLAAAAELHDLTAALGDDVWEWPENAPVGLGAAVLYEATGELAFLATAERIADMLCETQSGDGSWSGDPALTALAGRVLAESADAVEAREGVDVDDE
ncbi:MAG TPA: hypothetical protein VGO92_14020 [Acidimicrobiales bacterium]|jgi:hypothetical protein|nr:hypothetical protein [Acidimicrobiales bacterium]